MKVSAIIVAGGKGTRMNETVPKQYLDLGGQPILSHTIMALDACENIDDLIVVVPEKDIGYCRRTIISPLCLQKKFQLVPGGKKRRDSVYNGLKVLNNTTDIVLIHDGVRPFIKQEQVNSCIAGSISFGACIIGVPVGDTLKIVNQSGYIDDTLERSGIWTAQTPQAFRYDILLEAHETAKRKGYNVTDDATLVEKMGIHVKIIKGSKKNIKITTREDLELARTMLNG